MNPLLAQFYSSLFMTGSGQTWQPLHIYHTWCLPFGPSLTHITSSPGRGEVIFRRWTIDNNVAVFCKYKFANQTQIFGIANKSQVASLCRFTLEQKRFVNMIFLPPLPLSHSKGGYVLGSTSWPDNAKMHHHYFIKSTEGLKFARSANRSRHIAPGFRIVNMYFMVEHINPSPLSHGISKIRQNI